MAINMDAVLELSARVDGMSQLLQLERSLADVKGELNKYEGAQKTATQQSGLFNAATVALGGFMLDAAYKAAEFVKQSVALGFTFAQTENRMRMLAESYGEYDAVQALVSANADRLGVSQMEAAKAFTDVYGRLRPLGISLEEINGVYMGFNTVAAQSGVAGEEAAGAFFQLAQAMSSGSLRADDLNTVLGDMSGLYTTLAKEMNVPIGQIRKLASEGKITTDVLIAAFSTAAKEGGAQLDALAGSAANAGTRLGNAFQDFQALIGKELVPALAPFMDGLTEIVKVASDFLVPVVQTIAEGWQWVHSVITDQLLPALDPLIEQFRQATAGMDVTKIAKIWQGVMVVSIQSVIKAIEFLAPIVSAVVRAFRWMIDHTPFGIIAKQVAQTADWLAKVRDETIGVNKEAATTDKTMGSVAGKAAQIRTATVDTQEELKKQEEARKKLLEQMKEEQKYVDAITDKQKAILGIQLDQVEKQREKYNGTEAEFAALIRIRDLKLKQAELDYKAEQARIRSEVALAQMTDREAQVRLEILKIQYDSTKATINQAHEQEVLNERAERHAERVARIKALTQETTVETVALTEKTEEYTAEIEKATTHMIKLHGELREVDAAVVRISRGWMSVQQETILAAETAYNYEQYIKATAERIADLRAEGTATARELADAIRASLNYNDLLAVDRALPRMAAGGYVTSPTAALIGEGGEPEYVIPASKMGAAAGAFLSGARGPAVLQPAATSAGPVTVSIQTGPVVNMGGEQYVRKTDMSQAVNQAVAQVVQLLSGNSGVRQVVGI